MPIVCNPTLDKKAAELMAQLSSAEGYKKDPKAWNQLAMLMSKKSSGNKRRSS
jgi:hypothetical protein